MAKITKRADGRYQKMLTVGRRPDGTYIRKGVYARTIKALEEKVGKSVITPDRIMVSANHSHSFAVTNAVLPPSSFP